MRMRKEGADRGGAADLRAEGVGFPLEMADVFGVPDAAFEQGVVEMVGLGRSVRGEVRQVEDEAGTNSVAVRQKSEQLHPARVDSDERLVVGRGQARDRPVPALGPARDWEGGSSIEA